MTKKITNTFAVLAVVVLLAVTGYALEPPHDGSNNIDCDNCHATHSGGLIPRGAEQEALCKTCHNPTGQAATMSDVANHLVHDGNTVVDCGSCHEVMTPAEPNITDPHPGGQTAPNLKLIRGDTSKYVPDACEPAVFQQSPAHFAFDPNNAPWNGICQTCHIGTAHHSNDASADHDHKIGMDCITCHSHESGFAPSGGCTDCHNTPQGSRRQIVGPGGDFDQTSSHVSGEITDDDCTSCHDISQHQQGTVRLINPDNGTDPWTGTETDFCLTCHDGVPPANISFPPTNSGTGYNKSAFPGTMHETMLGTQSCRQCHEAHGSPFRSLLKNEYAIADYTDGNSIATDYQACWNCHDRNAVMAQTNAFGSRHSRHVENADTPCITCHDVHAPYDNNEPGLINFEFAINEGYNISYIGGYDANTSFWIDTGQNRGYCYIRCHNRDHNPKKYDRNKISTAGCINCHSSVQDNGDGIPVGGRRAVADDFGRISHHVNGSIQDSDCLVCHDTSQHQIGKVRLIDADTAAIIELTDNPMSNSTDAALLVPFCLNCHDDDGQTPFSDGQTVPFIDQNLWNASAHNMGGITAQPLTCMGDGVNFGCHGNAHGSNLRKMLQSYDGTPGTDNVNEEEGFCYNCHGASGVINETISNGWFSGVYENYADDIEEAFGLHSSHPVNDSASGHVFDIGNGPQELECTSCHGVHQATGKHWEATSGYTPVDFFMTGELWGDETAEKIANYDPNNFYLAPRIGEPGVDLLGNPLPIDGDGNSLLTDTVLPNYVSLCLECHQHALGNLVAINWTDLKHGSATAEPVDSNVGWPMAGPFDDASRGQYYMDCIDCHEAHGSRNYLLLKRSINGEIVDTIIDETTDKYWLSICDRCHISDPQARHHNDDVWCTKLGMCDGWPDCSVCHEGANGSIYSNCVSAGCHGHNDHF